jgi:rod shape-determining protein MreC
LSFIFITFDHLRLLSITDDIRAALTVVITPIVYLADSPNRAAEDVRQTFKSRSDLQSDITNLNEQLLLLKAKTEKMAALTAENNRLRDLLGSAAKLQDNVLVAELIGVDPDPERHEVTIDKGTSSGVFVGQPLLDAQGLMGQVIEISLYTSRVLLISDQTHSVPVQVNRSNLRLIARGSGFTRELELMHVQDTADIKVGDLLVSSGLGDRFPVGYPVAVVNKVEHDPGQPFALVTATPSARLDRSRYVLLVFTDKGLAGIPGRLGSDQGDEGGG